MEPLLFPLPSFPLCIVQDLMDWMIGVSTDTKTYFIYKKSLWQESMIFFQSANIRYFPPVSIVHFPHCPCIDSRGDYWPDGPYLPPSPSPSKTWQGIYQSEVRASTFFIFFSFVQRCPTFSSLNGLEKMEEGQKTCFIYKKGRRKGEILKCAQEDNQSVGFFLSQDVSADKAKWQACLGKGKGTNDFQDFFPIWQHLLICIPATAIVKKKKLRSQPRPSFRSPARGSRRLKMIFATGGCGNSGEGGLGL